MIDTYDPSMSYLDRKYRLKLLVPRRWTRWYIRYIKIRSMIEKHMIFR